MVGVRTSSEFHGSRRKSRELRSRLVQPTDIFLPRVFEWCEPMAISVSKMWRRSSWSWEGPWTGQRGLLSGLIVFVSLAFCGAFLRGRSPPCGLNFVAGVKGPPAGLDIGKRSAATSWPSGGWVCLAFAAGAVLWSQVEDGGGRDFALPCLPAVPHPLLSSGCGETTTRPSSCRQ